MPTAGRTCGSGPGAWGLLPPLTRFSGAPNTNTRTRTFALGGSALTHPPTHASGSPRNKRERSTNSTQRRQTDVSRTGKCSGRASCGPATAGRRSTGSAGTSNWHKWQGRPSRLPSAYLYQMPAMPVSLWTVVPPPTTSFTRSPNP